MEIDTETNNASVSGDLPEGLKTDMTLNKVRRLHFDLIRQLEMLKNNLHYEYQDVLTFEERKLAFAKRKQIIEDALAKLQQ